ncbi:MAG: hypothetical protein IJQ81_07100 [Oscillibacter sp.]|nr:hypothetical protein [Oscillibacter sp.]
MFTSGGVSGATGLSLYETVVGVSKADFRQLAGVLRELRELPAQLWRVSLRTAVRTLSGFPFGLPSYGRGNCR